MDAAAAAEDYRSSLNDLVANSKPLINMLTMLADENQQFAEHIVEVIETHIQKVKPGEKLPALYLIDSIIKNARDSPYVPLFTKNIAHIFCHVFEQVDEKTRQAMYKLRQTWNDIFPLRKLYAIDVLVSRIDPAWPVVHVPPQALTAPSMGIHVNPKFLSRPPATEDQASSVAAAATPAEQQQQRSLPDSDDVKKQLKAKQDELLKLQQQKLELELAHAKAQLEKLEKLKQQPAALSAPAAQGVLRKPEELQDPRISSRPRDAALSLRDQPHSISLASSLTHPVPPMSEDRAGESSSVRAPNHALANHGSATAGPITNNQRAPPPHVPPQRHHAVAVATSAAAYQAGWSATAAAVPSVAAAAVAAKAAEGMQGAGRSRRPPTDPRQELTGDGRPRGSSAGEASGTTPGSIPPPTSSAGASSSASRALAGMQGVSKRISPIRDGATFTVPRQEVSSKDKDERFSVRDIKQERAAGNSAAAAASSEKSKRAKAGDRVAKVSKGPVRSSDARPGDGKPPPPTGVQAVGQPAESSQQDQADRAPAAHRARIPLKGRAAVAQQNSERGGEVGEPGGASKPSASGSGERIGKGSSAQDKDERVPRADRRKADGAGRVSTAADVDMRVDAAKAKDGARVEVKESHARTEIKEKKQPRAVDSSRAAASSAAATRAGTKGTGGRLQHQASAGTTTDNAASGSSRQRQTATAPAIGAAGVDKDERIKPGAKNNLDKDDRIGEPKRSPIMAMRIPKKQPSERAYRRSGSPENGRRPGSPDASQRSRSRSPRARGSAQQTPAGHGDSDMRPRRRTPPVVNESPLQALDAQQAPPTAAVPPASAAHLREDVDLRKMQPPAPQHKGKPAPMETAVYDDVDLRRQPRKRQVRLEDEGKESPSMKKGRRSDDEDDFDDNYNEAGDLFGSLDQDYRRYPAGLPPASPAAHSGWTAFKETHQRASFGHGSGHRNHGPNGDVDLRQQQQQRAAYRDRDPAPRPTMQPPQHPYGGAPPRMSEAMPQQDHLRSLRSKAEWRYHNGDISREDYQDALARLEELQRLRPTQPATAGEWPAHSGRVGTPPGGGGSMHRFAGNDNGGPPLEQQHRLQPPVGSFNQPPPGVRAGTGQHSPVGRGHTWDWQQQPPPDGGSGFGSQQQQPQGSFLPPQAGGSGAFGMQQNVGFAPPQPGSGGRFSPPLQHGGGFVPPPHPPPQHPDFHGQYRGPAGYAGSQTSMENDRRYAAPLPSPVPGQMQRPRFESQSEVVIDGKPYELTLGLKARFINIGGRKWMVRADKDTREILIDELCYYRLGDPPREVSLAGQTHVIYFHGHRRHIWVDGLQYDVRVDAPPQTLIVSGRRHTLRIESHTNKLIVDGIEWGNCSSGPIDIDLGGTLHRVSFEPPPKQITIDNKLCELNFDGPLPVVVIDGRMHGIRFDGPPREIIIDDVPYLVPMDQPVRIKLGRRPHSLAFGGPGHEVVIDGKHYEVIFNGPQREVNIGGSSHTVRLVGDRPGVKILGEIQAEPRPLVLGGGGGMPLQPPLPPPPMLRLPGPPAVAPAAAAMYPPQPMMLPAELSAMVGQVQPPQLWLAPPVTLALPPFGLMPRHPIMAPMPTVMQPQVSALPPPPMATAPVDVNELFSKLLQYGIISKKEPDGAAPPLPAGAATAVDERLDDVPDLTDLVEEKLKGKHSGVLQRLYVGTQCATCGVRFLSSEVAKYNQHLDWHFRQNKREKEAPKTTLCRKWYFPIDVWVTYEEFTDADESNIFLSNAPSGGPAGAAAAASESVSCPIASGNEKDDVCEICGDPFEHFWGEEEEAWHLKDAIRVKGKTYHPICYEDACETSTIESAEPTTEVKDETSRSVSVLAKQTVVAAAPRCDRPAVTAAGPVPAAGEPPKLPADAPVSAAVAPAAVTGPPAMSLPPPVAMLAAAVDPGVPAALSVAAAAAAVDELRVEACSAVPASGESSVDAAGGAAQHTEAKVTQLPPDVSAAGDTSESGEGSAPAADGSPVDEYSEPGTPVQDERVLDGS